MKKILSFILLSAVVSISWMSYQPSLPAQEKLLMHVPSDVTTVTMIDVPAIFKKADFEAVQKMAFYQDAIKEATQALPIAGEILNDPAQSGIDLNRKIVIVEAVNPLDISMKFNGWLVSIKDESLFSKVISTMEMSHKTDPSGFNIIDNTEGLIAWNNKMALLGTLEGGGNANKIAKQFFTLTPDQSIVNNKKLQTAFASPHDISSWSNFNVYGKNEQVQLMLPMIGFPHNALEDNYINTYMDFNNGEIVATSTPDLQQSLTDDLDLLFKDEVKTNFSSVTPDNSSMLMTAAFDFVGWEKLIKKRPMAAMLEYAMGEYDISLADISSTFGGDIMTSMNLVDNEPVLTFATNLLDKSQLKKFLDLGIKMGLLKENGKDRFIVKNPENERTGSFTKNKAELIIKGDMIVISDNSNYLKKIAGRGFKGKETKAKLKKVASNIFGFHMGMNAFSELAGEFSPDDFNIDDMLIKSDRKQSDLKVSFSDDKTNSLKQLFQGLDKVYLKQQ